MRSTVAMVLAALAWMTLSPIAAKPLAQGAAEMQLGAKKLVGIWACAGSGDGRPVRATIRWYHLEDGSLWMTLHPTPAGKAHPTYLEQWDWEDYADTMGYRDWRTKPDPKSFDQASFTAQGAGFEHGKMIWIRHAAQSTMSRTFAWLGTDHLGLLETFGDPAAPHVVYRLDCKRTLKQEPPPQ